MRLESPSPAHDQKANFVQTLGNSSIKNYYGSYVQLKFIEEKNRLAPAGGYRVGGAGGMRPWPHPIWPQPPKNIVHGLMSIEQFIVYTS